MLYEVITLLGHRSPAAQARDHRIHAGGEFRPGRPHALSAARDRGANLD